MKIPKINDKQVENLRAYLQTKTDIIISHEDAKTVYYMFVAKFSSEKYTNVDSLLSENILTVGLTDLYISYLVNLLSLLTLGLSLPPFISWKKERLEYDKAIIEYNQSLKKEIT